MNALFAPGAKRNRILVALGLGLLLASPVMLLWASREEVSPASLSEDSPAMIELAERTARLYEGMALPAAKERNLEHAPFRDTFQTPRLLPGDPSQYMKTPLGHLDARNPQGLLRDVPQELLFKGSEVIRVPRGEAIAGLNYVQIDPKALATRSLDVIHAGIRKDARIIGYVSSNTLIVQVDRDRIASLGKNTDIAQIVPDHAAFRIDPDTARRPLIEARRAASDDLTLEVYSVPGSDTTALQRDLARIEGVRGVNPFGFDGSGYEVVAHYTAVAKIARLDNVLHVKERTEFMESNAKNSPTVQVGSWEDSQGLRPFDMAGVDGGGIDTNQDGQRINDGTDTVPPQIVGVTDNGISLDTPSFAQTGSQVFTASNPIGPSHRKVHFIQNIGDDGTSCDATLSGAGTHGNIVASTIAAYPSQLGVFLTRAGIGGAGQPRNADMDGVARGARIIVQDAGKIDQCTVNSLVERGGNVTPGRLIDDMNKYICPKMGGGIGPLCSGVTGGGGDIHVAVLPFGAPDQFSNTRFPSSNGTYPQEAADLDTFLYNNRDFSIVSPVGNSGGSLGGSRIQGVTPQLPDLFDGTAADDDPNFPQRIQVQPPSTAKNVISVGSSRSDDVTFFGLLDTENVRDDFASRGPVGGADILRTAPILLAPGSDLGGGAPIVSEIAGFRSRDNDNSGDIEAQVDSGNFGTSYAAASVGGAAAVVRDYFAQGFYPTGDRVAANRVPNVSGSLVKAALIASAKFVNGVTTRGQRNGSESPDAQVRRTRSMNMPPILGANIGILGNSEQGYGRVVLTQVLPLSNWSHSFVLEPNSPIGPQGAIEHPASGLLIWDDIATGEPLIGNTNATDGHVKTQVQHLFKVGSSDVTNTTVNFCSTAVRTSCTTSLDCPNGGVCQSEVARSANNTELRIGLAWTDVPSTAGSGGPLVNDLDLLLEGPGPDNCLFTGDIAPDGSTCTSATAAADNQFFDGNVYAGGKVNSIFDPWSLRRDGPANEVHDVRNPQEAIHMSSRYVDERQAPIYLGTYRVTVRSGTTGRCFIGGVLTTQTCANDTQCGAGNSCTPNRQISGIVATSEDVNGNRRLDPGTCSNSPSTPCFNNSGCVSPGTCVGTEDANQNGLLDLDGQAYSLVVVGPVFLNEAPPTRGPSTLPQGSISFSSLRYSCSDAAVVSIYDVSAGAGAARSKASTTFEVWNSSGTTRLDSESNIGFTDKGPGATVSMGVPVRLASPAVANDGILEADTGQQIVATYTVGGRSVTARAQVSCSPDFLNAFFLTHGQAFAVGDQDTVGGGCDGDEYLDAGEIVTYGVALQNRSRTDSYSDATATLTASGPGAGFIRILDPQKTLGRLPGSGTDGVFFHIFIDPTAADSTKLPIANRKVTFTLTLDASSKGIRLGRQSYSFTHAINADRDTRHYSTDFPGGGREVRDLNRNLLIDKPDVTDPFQLIDLPDEDITFDTMFVPGDASGRITNAIGEDLNGNHSLDQGEDVQPNGVLDPGILASGTTAPSAGDLVPWNFDQNNGGWAGFRHPQSSSPAPATNESWEYKTSGLCGFQTSGGVGKYGIWHTGDGDPNTPTDTSPACDNFLVPQDPSTPVRAEIYFDVLHSPIIAKVNQLNDARGFPYTVEFQRFAANFNYQTNNAYAGGGVNIDNDVDSDTGNCMLCQEMDVYYTRRFGGWPYGVFRFAGDSFPGYGFNPAGYSVITQRTFGPYRNPDNSVKLNGDESGFSGTTQNTDPYSASPIPTAKPDFLPFPVPDAGPLDPTPVAGVCTGGSAPGTACQTRAACSGGLNPGHLCSTNTDCLVSGIQGTCVTPTPCPGTGASCALESNTVAGPVRNFDTTLIGYEGGFSAPQSGIASPETYQPGTAFIPGKGGNRWEIGIGFFAIENAAPASSPDYGFAVDDVVFEWDETHPLDETQFTPAHTPACLRFGQPGQPAGRQCATVTADRTALYECEESIEVTVSDPNKPTAASVDVSVTTDSDSVHVTTQRFRVDQPGPKRFTLPAVGPGLFKGNITFSSQADNPTHVFTNPGTDSVFAVYYIDTTCDGDGDGQAGEVEFNNLDGDGIPDDGDHDGIAGDHPCRGGATTNCDDNCPLTYNPLQEDGDNDGVGDICDNCPTTYQRTCSNRTTAACQTDADCLFTLPGGGTSQGVCQSDQTDSSPDGVGDACEFDDVDGDGVDNDKDNCPDVYNPDQAFAQGTSGRGAACNGNGDLDGDGVADRSDNCVLTANSGQSNLDKDKLGDACDGDCPNITVVHICSNAPATACTTDSNCPAGGFCQTEVRHGSGTCSLVDDDADVDGIADASDDCPTIFNPAIIPGTNRQLDTDRDGLGDVCDPPQSEDDDFNGVPDDLPQFSGRIACNTKTLALAKLIVLSSVYKDVNGDQDAFPDPGEYGRVKVTLKNAGTSLTGVTFHLTSSDPDVACINSPTVVAASIPSGSSITLSDFDPTQPVDPNVPGFFFTASPNLLSVPLSAPAKVTLCLTLTANEALGVSAPICFNLPGDLDLKKICSNAPATTCTADSDCPTGGLCQVAGQTFTSGPAGGVSGTLFENFDTNAAAHVCSNDASKVCAVDADCTIRVCSNSTTTQCTTDADCVSPGTCTGTITGTCNPDSNFTVIDTFFNQGQIGIDANAHGSFLAGSYSGINSIAAVACGGFTTGDTNPGCVLNPAFPMDWHFHCASGSSNCPNKESGTITGSCATPSGTACSFNTPINGARGLAGGTTANSLSMGVHTNATDSLLGDTVHLRTVAAFVTPPINLAVFPRSGDLQMSFYQIVDLITGGGNGVSGPELGYDNADVQIRLDKDPDPNHDDWGFWDKLVPFENVYDHKAGAWSAFSPLGYYCNFTPADTGNAPPAPRNVHETMCFPSGIWSKCGDIRGTSTANTRSCAGGPTTRLDPSGRGVWVQSKFNLQEFLGQRVQIRWIGQTWMFDKVTDDYIAAGGGFATSLENDGWWIDDILITGTIQQQVTPVPDRKTPPAVNCNAPSTTGVCNPNLGDHGMSVIVQATDAGANVLDGVTYLGVSGQTLRISAVNSTTPGGCIGGAAQFQFFKNTCSNAPARGCMTNNDCAIPGVCISTMVQDWSSKTYFEDSPESDAVYSVKEQCSADTTNCRSQNAVFVSVPVYRGDSDDIVLYVTGAGAAATTLQWAARPQTAPLSGYDVFHGTLPDTPALATLARLTCDVPQAAPGTTISIPTGDGAPARGTGFYYLVGHSNPTAGSKPSLGRASNGSVIVAPVSCP